MKEHNIFFYDLILYISKNTMKENTLLVLVNWT